MLRTLALFAATALAEIVGCYLPYLWLRKDRSAWLLLPAGVSLALFAWLLSLHPTAMGRTYAAYGGVYVTVAVFWLWIVESTEARPLGSVRGGRDAGGDDDHRLRPAWTLRPTAGGDETAGSRLGRCCLLSRDGRSWPNRRLS